MDTNDPKNSISVDSTTTDPRYENKKQESELEVQKQKLEVNELKVKELKLKVKDLGDKYLD